MFFALLMSRSYSDLLPAAPLAILSIMSALADIADENELRHGTRQEGMLYAARTFFAKADGAVGLFIAGIALDIIAFPVNSTPGSVDAEVLFKLGLVDSPLTIIPGLIGAMFYAGYRIDRVRHEEIMAALMVKRVAKRGWGGLIYRFCLDLSTYFQNLSIRSKHCFYNFDIIEI